MITQERLKELLHYDPDTGFFTWVVSVNRKVKIGDVAGTIGKKGYVQIQADGKQYKAHRLAFLYMLGYMPEHQVDHKKGVKHDNRWSEIRHVTQICNSQNRKLDARSTSGFVGVGWHKQHRKWRAYIGINGKLIDLGYHHDKISAALARCHFEKCCEEWTCNTHAVNFVKLRELGYSI